MLRSVTAKAVSIAIIPMITPTANAEKGVPVQEPTTMVPAKPAAKPAFAATIPITMAIKTLILTLLPVITQNRG